MPRETIILLTEEQGAITSPDPRRYVFSAEWDDEISLDGAFTVQDLLHIIARKVGNTESVVELCKQFDSEKGTKICAITNHSTEA